MKHLQNQTNNRQKSDGLRQALNGEVNFPDALDRDNSASAAVSALTL
jgi:hypothetical protein